MRLGADPDGLDRLAAEFRGAARTLDGIGSLAVPAVAGRHWAGPDGARLAAELRRSVAGPVRRAAADLERLARRLVTSGREQRRASERRPGVVLEQRRVSGTGDGRLVQRVGPWDARTVVVLVPGVGTDPTDRPRLAADAGHVWSAVAGASGRGGVAVVSWLGYDPPDHLPGALDPGPAERGSRDLVATVAGLRARGATRVTVVGHSYGGVVVGRAVGHGLDADAVVLLGSPGTGAPDLRLARAGLVVAAARAEGDPIAHVVGRARPLYGPDPLDGAVVLPTSRSGHSSYLRDPVLLDAVATIATRPTAPDG